MTDSGVPQQPEVIRPGDFSGSSHVVAALSTRCGGVSRPPFGMNLSYRVGDDPSAVDRNRVRFFGASGIKQSELAIPLQVHGTNVQRVTAPGEYPDCDGLMTDLPSLFLCVTCADCVPVLLFDPARKVVAAVHAGWRGTAGGIAASAVGLMEQLFGCSPADIVAFLGQAAGPCCYRVGEEVAAQFPPHHVRKADNGITIDLPSTCADQLATAGVPPAQIEILRACTICTPGRFHSHRRDGLHAGRMMAVIGLSGVRDALIP